jgi:hypothetical protein
VDPVENGTEKVALISSAFLLTGSDQGVGGGADVQE